MDPIGYAFEFYDAVGRYRETEHGAPIDGRGELVGLENATFETPAELAKLLAEHPQAQGCFIQTLFQYAQGRVVRPEDACALERATKVFEGAGGSALSTLASILVANDAYMRSAPSN